MFEKTLTNKKIINGWRNNLLWRKKTCSIFTVFVGGICLLYCAFSFLTDFLTYLEKTLAIVTKCSALDVAGVLKPWHTLTWITSTGSLIQVLD